MLPAFMKRKKAPKPGPQPPPEPVRSHEERVLDLLRPRDGQFAWPRKVWQIAQTLDLHEYQVEGILRILEQRGLVVRDQTWRAK